MDNKLSKFHELEERMLVFAKQVIFLCGKLPRTSANTILVHQIVRSASSVGANYIEANEALGKKDFVMRLRISRKEAKETAYWLRLIEETNLGSNLQITDYTNHKQQGGISALLVECGELRNILTAILKKSTSANL